MLYMNDHDILVATHRFSGGDTPNREYAARTVARLADWADSNSDGWHSWPKPCRAAKRLIELVGSTTYQANLAQEEVDATDAELKAALSPVKAFLTREGVDHSEVLP